jgi:hypothetical protein
MPETTVTFRVCSACGGVIPGGAAQITGVHGRLQTADGSLEDFQALDFCCSDHMAQFMQSLPVIPEPTPAYDPPNGNVVAATTGPDSLPRQA